MQSKRHTQPEWSAFYKTLLPLAWLSSQWRARYTYNLLRGLKIKTILELGAGTGFCAHYLSGKTGASISLLDKDETLIKELNQRYPDKEIICADLFTFSPSRKWDLVYSLGVIEHLPAQKRIRAIKIHQALSCKYVLIAVPVKSWFRNNLLHPLVKHHVGYEKLYHPKELVQEFNRAGLEPLKTASNPLGVTILAEINNKP